MSNPPDNQDSRSPFVPLVGVFIVTASGLVATLDSDFVKSLFTMYNRFDCSNPSGYGCSPASQGFYTRGVKDIYTIVGLHLVIFVFFGYIWDIISINRPGFSRKKLLFYSTSAFMLMSCLVFDVIAVTKKDFWAGFRIWWNGQSMEIMSFYDKLYFLVQTALLCYFLESLCLSGQRITSMLDSWIDGTLNLVFSIICYVQNFLPLMMVIFAPRFFLQTGVSLVQVMSLLELSDKQNEIARAFSRALRWLTGGEVICYASLIAAITVYGSFSVDKQVSILVPLCAMLGVSTFRVASSRKFDLDLLRAGHVESLGPLSTDTNHVNDTAPAEIKSDTQVRGTQVTGTKQPPEASS